MFALVILNVATTVAISEDRATTELAMSQGVTQRLAAGWQVADLRPSDEEYAVTLTNGGATEVHLFRGDANNQFSYVVENAARYRDPHPPEPALAAALTAGFALAPACGGWELEPYLGVEVRSGRAAGALLAQTLRGAEDLVSVSADYNRIAFRTTRGARRIDAVVLLDEDHRVLETQVRTFDGGGPNPETLYLHGKTLRKAMSGAIVTAVAPAGSSYMLETTKGRYAIDPAGDAFRYGSSGEGECGC